MKRTILPILCAAAILVGCDENASRTTVSESLFAGRTIVSRPASNGTFTRTEYGRDLFGNRITKVSRGHQNATQQGDLAMFGLHLAVALAHEVYRAVAEQ